MRFVLRIFCLLFLLPGAMAFQITEVYPDTFLDGDEDEYLVLTAWSSGVQKSLDGEGRSSFLPIALRNGHPLPITRQYQRLPGEYPDMNDRFRIRLVLDQTCIRRRLRTGR